MHLRFATTADAAAMLAIYTPYVTNTTVSWEYAPPPLAEFTGRIASHAAAGFPWLCAEENGALLGYAYASRYAARRGYDYSVETTVYVSGAAHRRGAGKALYRALLALLTAQGYCTAFALITDPNPKSDAFHRALGFTKEASLPRMGYKQATWLNLGVYARPLCALPDRPAPTIPVQNLPAQTVRNILTEACHE